MGKETNTMKVLVSGSGRGGTNWVSEIVKATGKFHWVGIPEDRLLPTRKSLPPNYATKLAIENDGFDEALLKRLIAENDDLKILWCLRHPVDHVMAKIARGRPASQGGDKMTEQVSDDGTVEAAIAAVRRSFDMYNTIWLDGPCIAIWLHRLIQQSDHVALILSKFLDVPKEEINMGAFANTPNRYHLNRYGASVDKSQVDIHERWKTAYDGYFADKEDVILKIKYSMSDLCKEWLDED